MDLTSLPFVGHLYLPLLLTSLILGIIILIFFEKRKSAGKITGVKSYTEVKPVSNGIYSDHSRKSSADIVHTEGVKLNNSQDTSSDVPSQDSFAEIRGQTESSLVCSKNPDHEKVNIKIEKNSQERTPSCSSSEEDTAKLESKVLRTRKKHSCSGAKTCSKKETVSKVLIVTDIEDEQLKAGLEDLAEKFKTGGLTCTIRSSQDTHQPLLKAETSRLIIFLVTSSDNCGQLQDILKITETHEPTAAFIYSVACLTETSHGDDYEAAGRLNVALSELGEEWHPLTCITHTGQTQDPTVLSSHQYITTILDKVKKLSKKCCGKSCSSQKAADIEDLAASLLPVVTPVKT